MKSLTITIQVPDWVEWVATDNDNQTYGHAWEPVINASGSWWVSDKRVRIIHRFPLPLNFEGEDWKESKRRVGEYIK